MKTFKLALTFLLISSLGFAQKSPKKEAIGTIGDVNISISYSAPSVKGRTIWGKLVPYGKVWRAGANENTTITFDKDVIINGMELAAGKYGCFIIPIEEGDWTLIFNKKNDAWGAKSYNQEEDALRINSTPDFASVAQELLFFSIGENTIKFAWEKVRIELFVLNKEPSQKAGIEFIKN